MLNFAIRVAKDAGRLLRDRFGTRIDIDHKGSINIVTDVDLASERLIREAISTSHPRHEILAEEGHHQATELADLFCRGARQRIKTNFARFYGRNDGAIYRVSQRVLAGHHAWLEEGIVGLMTDETPAPSGSKGSRATQELRQAEGVGVA